MKIVQRIASGLTDDKLPVAIGMGKFLEENVQPFGQAVIIRHDLLKHRVFGIDDHIDLITGQIDFKGSGFDHPISPELKRLKISPYEYVFEAILKMADHVQGPRLWRDNAAIER